MPVGPVIFKLVSYISTIFGSIVSKIMAIDPDMMTIDLKIMMIDPKMMMIDPNMMMIDPKMMLLQETNLKITGPTGIFGENRDHKTIIREPLANDPAHMSDERTVLMNYKVYGQFQPDSYCKGSLGLLLFFCDRTIVLVCTFFKLILYVM